MIFNDMASFCWLFLRMTWMSVAKKAVSHSRQATLPNPFFCNSYTAREKIWQATCMMENTLFHFLLYIFLLFLRLYDRLLPSVFMQPVAQTIRATTMVTASFVNSLGAFVWFPMFFTMPNCFIKTHVTPLHVFHSFSYL